MANEIILVDENINPIFEEIKGLINNSRDRVYSAVNTEMLNLYWNIGKIIMEIQNGNERATYGKSVLENLSQKLTNEFGKGFSISNLYNMRLFYMNYKKFQTVSGKLSWSHYCELLTISDSDKRNFYEKETINAGWSIRELKRQISTSFYERLLLSEGKTNKEQVESVLNEWHKSEKE